MRENLRKPNNRGWTIIELMMVVGIIGLIVPALTSLFMYCYQGLATAEMHLQLKALNEKMMLHLHEQMGGSKHMFQNDTASGGLNFIGQIAMGSAPASVSFSALPEAQSGTTVTFSPAAGAVSSEFGDCLFYAEYDRPQTINGLSYPAPLTITGVTNGAGKSVTLNLDVYRFYYDYLTSTGDLKRIANLSSYWLIEWQSVQFVDAFELLDIASTDGTLFTHVINWLTTAGNFPSGQAITLAWDPTQTAMTSGSSYAFYQLSGGTTIGEASQSISIQNWTPLSRTSSGLIAQFNYGISGNYNNVYGDPPPPIVPKFAPSSSVTNGFPGGFEVGLQGSNAGMQVMIRSLLLARGNSKALVWDDETSVSSARDVW
ncbi:MAG TPA: hypothetical protein VK791_09825 [bacterium]|jgi:type II secretory pathway pseudopilin PulG|nr:hypothetical protein [bacterium]